jgi:hypothetical protein
MRTSTLAGAALVAALAGTLLTACDDDATTEAHDYRISTPVSRLSVRVDTGDVEVIGSDAPGVLVHEVLHYSHGRKPATSRQVVDGTLSTRHTCPHPRSWREHRCDVSYRIEVPRGTEVTADADTGDVRVRGMAGAVRVTDATGDVEGTALTSHDVRASTETGDVRLHLLAAPDSVKGTAATGDVWITVPAGHLYRVSAGTDTGSSHVSVPDTPSAPSAITAHTNTGSVRVGTG